MVTCKRNRCNDRCYGKGLCRKHYRQQKHRKKYLKQYYLDNREEILKQAKQYRKDNKEYFIEYRKQWYQDNREHVLEQKRQYNKQWYQDNKEEVKQHYQNNKKSRLKYQKQYQQKNKKRLAEYSNKYYRTPNGNIRRRTAVHKRRKKMSTLTIKTIQRVYRHNIKQYGVLTCILCRKPIAFGEDSLEHLTPLSRKGSNKYKNLGVSHRTCNYKKGIMTLKEWFEKQEKDML